MSDSNTIIDPVTLFKEIANGSQAAYDFCVLWSSYCHKFDDIVDGDIAPQAANFVEVDNLLTRVLTCEFFRANGSIILAQKLLISESYVASEVMRQSENTKRKEWGLFLSHAGNDMLRLVSIITGGEPHLQYISEKLRTLTLKEHYA